MEKWRIKIIHLVYFSLTLSLVIFMSIGCGGGSSGSGGAGGGSRTTNPVSINDDTNAYPESTSIAFNSTGDALAVWISNNGSSQNRILYSFYDHTTATWSLEAELTQSVYTDLAVCSNGTNFMVVWAYGSINAREYIVSSGTWGTMATIELGGNYAFSPHVASTGTGYCAVWSQFDGTDTRIYANFFGGSGWGTETTVDSGGGYAYDAKVASNATGYCVTWTRQEGAFYNIYASIYTTGPWGTETLLESAAGNADYPQIASDGAGYCVTWEQDDGVHDSIYANVYEGSPVPSWGGATLIESGGTYDAHNPKIASDGTGYGVVWLQYDALSGNRVYGNEYDNTIAIPAWGGDGTIDSDIGACSYPDVASNGSGYGVTWRLYDSGSSTYNIRVNIYDSGTDSWGTETLLETGSGEAIYPHIAPDGTGYGVVWIQDDGSRNTVYANLNSGSGWGTEHGLMQDQYHGSVSAGIRFAANNAGDVLAIWRQYDNDAVILYGCLYSSGAWGSTFEIVTNLYYYDVASDGDGFMIVHNHYSSIHAVTYDTTTGLLGTDEQISGNSAYECRITSDGTGYCATWIQYDTSNPNIYANIYDGSSWLAPGGLTAIDSLPGSARLPQVASNGTGYCVTWYQNDGTYDSIYANIYTSAWGGATPIESGINDADIPSIASDGTGYCVAWDQHNDIYANVYEGSWGTATLIEIGSGHVNSPQVASNGSSYGVTWEQSDGSASSIYVNLYDGAWGTEMAIESGSGDARYPRGASNGTGYCVSWVQDDGTVDSAFANTFDGSTWGTEQALESSDTEVNRDWEKLINVVATQDTYTIGWLQKDANDPLVDNAWAYSGLSD